MPQQTPLPRLSGYSWHTEETLPTGEQILTVWSEAVIGGLVNRVPCLLPLYLSERGQALWKFDFQGYHPTVLCAYSGLKEFYLQYLELGLMNLHIFSNSSILIQKQ